jgi:hypothetical protein
MGLIQPAVQGIIVRKLKPAALPLGNGRNTLSLLMLIVAPSAVDYSALTM